MGLILKLKGLLGAVWAFAGLSKFLAVAKWLPGLGPVAGIASAVLGFLALVARKTIEGITIMFSNPATFVVAGLVGMSAFAFGVIHGGQKGAERVAVLVQERNDAHAEAERRLKEALAAQRAAELEAEAAKADATDRHAVARASDKPSSARPRRVRKPAETSGNGFCLPGFQALFPGCQTSGLK